MRGGRLNTGIFFFFSFMKKDLYKKNRRKCTYVLAFFHFDPYILISSLLVHKSISAYYFGSFR